MESRPTLRRSLSYANFADLRPAMRTEPLRVKVHSPAGDLIMPLIGPDEAERISEIVGPRVQVWTDKYSRRMDWLFPDSKNKDSIITIGCPGDEGPGQRAVARLNEWIFTAHPGMHITRVKNVGDNAYPKGMASCYDPLFNSVFYDMYYLPEYRYSSTVNIRVGLGNHDGKYYMKPWLLSFIWTQIQGKAIEKHQVIHAQMYHHQDPVVPVIERQLDLGPKVSKSKLPVMFMPFSKQQLYMSPVADVIDQPKFNMPFYFNGTIKDQVQDFDLNSNSILRDLFEALNHVAGLHKMRPEELRKNQVYFLFQQYDECKAANRQGVVYEHNFFKSLGKRWYLNKADSKFHHSDELIKKLDRILQLPSIHLIKPLLLGKRLKPEEKAEATKLLKMLYAILHSPENDLDKIEGIPFPTFDAKNFGIMLARFNCAFGLKWLAHVNAHDHMLGVINTKGMQDVSLNYDPKDENTLFMSPNRPDNLANYPFFQITNGAGGGELQENMVFSQPEDNLCCVEDNGTAVLTLDKDHPENLTVDIFTVKHPRSHELALMDHRVIQPEKGKFYVRWDGNALEYTVMNDKGLVITDTFSGKELESIIEPFNSKILEPFSLAKIERFFPKILEAVVKRDHISAPKNHGKMLEWHSAAEDHLHLRFTNQSREPVREPLKSQNPVAKRDREKVDALRDIVISSCRAYQEFLANRQKLNHFRFFQLDDPHSLNDIQIMNKMLNFVNQYEPRNYVDNIAELYDLSKLVKNKMGVTYSYSIWGRQEHQHPSFLKDINAKLKASKLFHKDLEGLYNAIKVNFKTSKRI